MSVENPKDITKGLEAVRKALDTQREHLPNEEDVVEVSEERYRSQAYLNRGFQYLPDRYGTHDGYLYTVTCKDGSQLFVSRNRDSSNPFDAMAGGVDMRPWLVFIYQYDGRETITATDPKGKVSEYKGESGKPEAMLPTLRTALGQVIATQKFTGSEQSPAI